MLSGPGWDNMGEIRLVGPGKTRGYPYPVCKKKYFELWQEEETILRLASAVRPRGYKIFFLLNSIDHEILKAHKYKNIKKLGLF